MNTSDNITDEIPGNIEFGDYSEMRQSYKSIFISSKIISKEHNDSRIQCISVNSKGEIAVSIGEYINVYDSDGSYLYGYYIASPKPNVISLHDNYIEIYFDIYSSYFTIDRNGVVDSMRNINFSSGNKKLSDSLYTYSHASKWNVGDITYISSGDELIKRDCDGNESIIYKMSEIVKKSEINDLTIAVIVFGIFIMLSIFNIIWKFSIEKNETI